MKKVDLRLLFNQVKKIHFLLKMVDVPIAMDNLVKTGSVVYGCLIQLGVDTVSQSFECNIAYASPTASGEPQRIIIVL